MSCINFVLIISMKWKFYFPRSTSMGCLVSGPASLDCQFGDDVILGGAKLVLEKCPCWWGGDIWGLADTGDWSNPTRGKKRNRKICPNWANSTWQQLHHRAKHWTTKDHINQHKETFPRTYGGRWCVVLSSPRRISFVHLRLQRWAKQGPWGPDQTRP